MNSNLKICKHLSSFKRELTAKIIDGNGINYKTVKNFISELNTLLGSEIVKCKTTKTTNHTYTVSNRVRYNDSFKKGVSIEIEFLGKKYSAHTTDQYQANGLVKFISDSIGDNVFETAKKLIENSQKVIVK